MGSFELTGGRVPVRSVVTIDGDSEVLIENCRRLVECSEIKCSVISAGFLVEVWGSGLSASSYANGSASICGRIQSVNVTRRSSRRREEGSR